MMADLKKHLSVGSYKLDKDIFALLADFTRKIDEFNESHKSKVKNPGDDGTGKPNSKSLDPIKLCEHVVKKSWYEHRGKLKQPKLNYFRWNLYAFLRHLYKDRNAIESAMKISLPYLPSRRLVVKSEMLTQLPLDVAHALLWKARTYTPRSIKNKKSLAIARFCIELLWQGHKVQDVLKISPISLDLENRLIFSIIDKLGRGYQVAALSPVSAKYLESPLRVLRSWIKSSRSGKSQSLNELEGQPTVYRLTGRLLREAAKQLGLDPKIVTHENFRNAGILHRIVSEDIAPVAITAFTGLEPSTNVMKPASVYGYFPTSKNSDLQEKVSSLKSIEGKVENKLLKPKKSSRDTEVWEMVSGCRRLFKDYDDIVRLRASEGERSRIKRKIKVQLGRWREEARIVSIGTGQSWNLFFGWLISMVQKRLKPRSVARYMEPICNVLDYCYINEVDVLDLTLEDVREIIAGEEDVIAKRAIRNIKTPLNHFFTYLKDKGEQPPELNLNALMKLANKNPRMIDLPSKDQIDERIKMLYGGVIPRLQDAALIGLMGGCLGLRESEIASVQVQDIRIFDGDNDYLVVYRGKGGKQRRVALSKLAPEVKQVFYEAYEKACQRFRVDSSNWFLQTITTPAGVETSFSNFWRDIAPEGVHTLRHAYATNEYLSGTPLLDIGVSMGHSTLRTLVVNYIQSVWYKEWVNSRGLSWEAPVIKDVNLKELESLTLYAHSRAVRITDELGLRKKVNQSAYRRGGSSTWQMDLKTCLQTLLKKPHELGLISRSHRIMELYR